MASINDLYDGLFLLKQTSGKFGVDHYAVLCVGNILGIPNLNHPYIIHQTPPEIKIEKFNGTGSWEIIGAFDNEKIPEAKIRLIQALNDKDYRLFTNNCEQFARYITEGKKYSTQVRGVAVVAAIIGLVLVSNNDQ